VLLDPYVLEMSELVRTQNGEIKLFDKCFATFRKGYLDFVVTW